MDKNLEPKGPIEICWLRYLWQSGARRWGQMIRLNAEVLPPSCLNEINSTVRWWIQWYRMRIHMFIYTHYVCVYMDHFIPVSVWNVVLHSAALHLKCWLETMIHCSGSSMSGISGSSFKLHMENTGIHVGAYKDIIYIKTYIIRTYIYTRKVVPSMYLAWFIILCYLRIVYRTQYQFISLWRSRKQAKTSFCVYPSSTCLAVEV